jgi:PAS domain S-box-containing protein
MTPGSDDRSAAVFRRETLVLCLGALLATAVGFGVGLDANVHARLPEAGLFLLDGFLALLLYLAPVSWLLARRRRAALLRRDRDLSALLQLSKELEQSRDHPAILAAVGAAVERGVGFTECWMYLADPDDPDTLLLLTGRMKEGPDLLANVPRLPARGDAMIEEILASRRPVVVEDARTDPRTNKTIVAELGNRTIVNVPMIMADRRLGAFGTGTFGDQGIRRLSGEEIDFLDAVGSRAAVAVDRLRHYTGRLRAEEENRRLATALDQADDLVAIVAPDGTVIYVNPAYTRITGHSAADVVGKPFAFDESGAEGDVIRPDMKERIAHGGPWRGRIVSRTKEGTPFEMNLSVTPVVESGGAVTNLVAVGRDVSDEARLARAKAYFTAITSHELRTPLTKLQLATPLIRELAGGSFDPGRADALIRSLDESSEGFAKVVTATSLLTRLQGTPAPLTGSAPVALVAVAAKRIDEAQARVRRAGRRVTIEAVGASRVAAARVVGDEELIGLALDEVISNAVKYSPDGSTVTIRFDESDEGYIIEVSDRGVGMTPEEARLAMEPFFSLENPVHHSSGRYRYRGGGVGLGLTIAKMVVEYFGGRIEIVRGDDGVGATVRFHWRPVLR